MNYTEANAKLIGRNKDRRKIANNTYLERRAVQVSNRLPSGGWEDRIAVRLHATDILTYFPDGRVEVNSGGYRTVTTKARVNEYLPYGFSITQQRGQWYVERRNPEYEAQDKGWEYYAAHPEEKRPSYWIRVKMYEDGMTLFPDGRTLGGTSLKEEGDKLALRRKVQRYAAAYIKAFQAGEVPKPGAGDCFYCGMRTKDVPKPGAIKSVSATAGGGGAPVGEALGDTSHLLSHIEEQYFVPSLLARAFEVMPHSQTMGWAIAEAWGDEQSAAGDAKRKGIPIPEFVYGQLQKSLSRYILRQLGQAA